MSRLNILAGCLTIGISAPLFVFDVFTMSIISNHISFMTLATFPIVPLSGLTLNPRIMAGACTVHFGLISLSILSSMISDLSRDINRRHQKNEPHIKRRPYSVFGNPQITFF